MKKQTALSFKRTSSRGSVRSTSLAGPKSARSDNEDKSGGGFNFLNEEVLCSLDKDILNLCEELEELGGGISTKIEPIQT